MRRTERAQALGVPAGDPLERDAVDRDLVRQRARVVRAAPAPTGRLRRGRAGLAPAATRPRPSTATFVIRARCRRAARRARRARAVEVRCAVLVHCPDPEGRCRHLGETLPWPSDSSSGAAIASSCNRGELRRRAAAPTVAFASSKSCLPLWLEQQPRVGQLPVCDAGQVCRPCGGLPRRGRGGRTQRARTPSPP